MMCISWQAVNHCCQGKRELLLLVSVFPKTLFTLVRGHFVLLSFLSARHMNVLIFIRQPANGV